MFLVPATALEKWKRKRLADAARLMLDSRPSILLLCLVLLPPRQDGSSCDGGTLLGRQPLLARPTAPRPSSTAALFFIRSPFSEIQGNGIPYDWNILVRCFGTRHYNPLIFARAFNNNTLRENIESRWL